MVIMNRSNEIIPYLTLKTSPIPSLTRKTFRSPFDPEYNFHSFLDLPSDFPS
jgi:hypothetical protein